MILSAEQIKQIAKEIAFDIHQYIIEHQEEYQLFNRKRRFLFTQTIIQLLIRKEILANEYKGA